MLEFLRVSCNTIEHMCKRKKRCRIPATAHSLLNSYKTLRTYTLEVRDTRKITTSVLRKRPRGLSRGPRPCATDDGSTVVTPDGSAKRDATTARITYKEPAPNHVESALHRPSRGPESCYQPGSYLLLLFPGTGAPRGLANRTSDRFQAWLTT